MTPSHTAAVCSHEWEARPSIEWRELSSTACVQPRQTPRRGDLRGLEGRSLERKVSPISAGFVGEGESSLRGLPYARTPIREKRGVSQALAEETSEEARNLTWRKGLSGKKHNRVEERGLK